MEYLSSLLCQATRLAAQAHDGAYRKGGRAPYLLHVMETAEIVGTMTEDEDVLAAAVLHDVLEDTSVTEEELRETVGGHVTELVLAVSENKRREQPAEMTWRLRKQESVERLLKEPRLEVKMIGVGRQALQHPGAAAGLWDFRRAGLGAVQQQKARLSRGGIIRL